MDLNAYGIKVSEIKPGLVETEFSEVRFKGDLEKAKEIYKGYDPLQAKDIAECIAFILSRPKHVNIGDMVVLPLAQASSNILNKQKIYLEQNKYFPIILKTTKNNKRMVL